MARKIREQSQNGVYHVMVRGIDRQEIFIDDYDRRMFLKILKDNIQIPDKKDEGLKIRAFRLFSYCLMSNHAHLLIQEIEQTSAQFMQRICTRYAMYFNAKYTRIGHLFQDRFRSEPCNDVGYFLTLVRYIHQNPVKAGICETPEQYAWNSWNEIRFAAGQPVSLPFADVCDKKALFDIAFFEELDHLVHMPVSDRDNCLDIDKVRIRINNDKVRCMIGEFCNLKSISDFVLLETEKQKQAVIRFLESGATISQICSITGMNRRVLCRLVE
ncbi:MAG: transposase [Bacteroidaceae bacterium]|nr:transposase [Bacteroidaceae bacterium]